MLPRYENRVQLAMALVVGLLLVANLFTLALVALTPHERGVRAPVLYTVFIITLLVSLPAIFLLPRWLLRPYRQLVGEAKRAPVAPLPAGARDETEFVLETFQAVVAQLSAQQKELEKLSAQASARAASAEMFNERIVASVPSGLVAFDARGVATVVNGRTPHDVASLSARTHRYGRTMLADGRTLSPRRSGSDDWRRTRPTFRRHSSPD